MDFINQIFDAAKKHGQQSDPDHEVGDLQQLVRDLWAALTPDERKIFELRSGRVIDWMEFIDQWSGR